MSLGQSVEEITSIAMSSEAQLGLEALQLFGEAVVTYDLTPMPVGGDNGSEDVMLKEDGELPEGPVPM